MQRHVLTVALTSSLTWFAALLSSSCSGDSSNGGGGDAAAGKTAVAKYACTGCHGDDLSGSTMVYQGSMAYPANLTPDSDTGIGDWDVDTIKAAILTGKDDEGKMLCPTMPRFGTMNMTDTEATNIATYLKTLAAVSKEVPESECASAAAGSGG